MPVDEGIQSLHDAIDHWCYVSVLEPPRKANVTGWSWFCFAAVGERVWRVQEQLLHTLKTSYTPHCSAVVGFKHEMVPRDSRTLWSMTLNYTVARSRPLANLARSREFLGLNRTSESMIQQSACGAFWRTMKSPVASVHVIQIDWESVWISMIAVLEPSRHVGEVAIDVQPTSVEWRREQMKIM